VDPKTSHGTSISVYWTEYRDARHSECNVIVASANSTQRDTCPTAEDIEAFIAPRYRRMLETSGLIGDAPERDKRLRRELVTAQLRDLGRSLFEKFSTRAFSDAIRRSWASEGTEPIRSVQIWTNSPALPWELMVPTAADGQELPCSKPKNQPCFLGTAVQIARWHLVQGGERFDRPPTWLRLNAIAAIAPAYKRQQLKYQSQELKAISRLHGYTAVPAVLDGIKQLLSKPPEGIVHFAGHGAAQERPDATDYAIQLEDSVLDLNAWRGMTSPMDTGRPLYFFNACEVGQARRMRNFLDGWAPAVIQTGATGFVGSLWPVSDAAASAFARAFYSVIEKGVPGNVGSPAEMVRIARSAFYETGDPSYLGYVYYGNVNLRLQMF
jgi:hypothetical protein